MAAELLLEHHIATLNCLIPTDIAPGKHGDHKGDHLHPFLGKDVLDHGSCLLLKATRSYDHLLH